MAGLHDVDQWTVWKCIFWLSSDVTEQKHCIAKDIAFIHCQELLRLYVNPRYKYYQFYKGHIMLACERDEYLPEVLL